MIRRKSTGFFMIAVLLGVCMLFALFGCDEETVPDPAEDVNSGGTTDLTDYDAPKEIASKDITDYYAEFFLTGEWSPGRENQQYIFEVKADEQGELTASESSCGVSAPADRELLAALQAVVEAHNLVSRNGVYKVTAGLPPEFQECRLKVGYASGENLQFTENNDPEAEWARQTYLVFADWFAKKGDDSMLPPEIKGQVERIIVRFNDNGLRYNYSDITVMEEDAVDGERYLFGKDVYDSETLETVSEGYVLFPDDFYDRVTEIVSGYDLRPFDSISVLYGTGRNMQEGDEPDFADLQLHIVYEGGHRLNIDTNDPGDIELLRPLLADLFAYYDSLFDAEQTDG